MLLGLYLKIHGMYGMDIRWVRGMNKYPILNACLMLVINVWEIEYVMHGMGLKEAEYH